MNRQPYTAISMTAILALAGYFALTAAAAGAGPVDTHGAASVSGTVRFDGPAPKPAHIVMAADQNCAKAHPSGANSEDVVVGTNGALGNVIVYISDGLAPGSFEPPPTPVTLEQKGCMYEPHVVAMQAHQKLRVTNDDGTTHNIHPLPQNNREWNKSQPPGMQALEESFPREEIAIPIKCNIHPWMKSYVAVFKHPYFAVTSKDGSFSIRNLPPGSYTLMAWHEKLGTQIKKITVAANSANVDFSFKAR
jgi:hypothetical protein